MAQDILSTIFRTEFSHLCRTEASRWTRPRSQHHQQVPEKSNKIYPWKLHGDPSLVKLIVIQISNILITKHLAFQTNCILPKLFLTSNPSNLKFLVTSKFRSSSLEYHLKRSLIRRDSLYGHLCQQCPLHGVSFTLWLFLALEGLNTFTGMNGTHGNQHAKLWAGSAPQSVRSCRKHLHHGGDGLLITEKINCGLWDNASQVMLMRKHHYVDTCFHL